MRRKLVERKEKPGVGRATDESSWIQLCLKAVSPESFQFLEPGAYTCMNWAWVTSTNDGNRAGRAHTNGHRTMTLRGWTLKRRPSPGCLLLLQQAPPPHPAPGTLKSRKVWGHLKSTPAVCIPSWPPGKRRNGVEGRGHGAPSRSNTPALPSLRYNLTSALLPTHPHLLAEMPDAPDLEGAGRLHVLALEEDGGARHLGQRPALQQRRDHVEVPALSTLRQRAFHPGNHLADLGRTRGHSPGSSSQGSP